MLSWLISRSSSATSISHEKQSPFRVKPVWQEWVASECPLYLPRIITYPPEYDLNMNNPGKEPEGKFPRARGCGSSFRPNWDVSKSLTEADRKQMSHSNDASLKNLVSFVGRDFPGLSLCKLAESLASLSSRQLINLTRTWISGSPASLKYTFRGLRQIFFLLVFSSLRYKKGKKWKKLQWMDVKRVRVEEVEVECSPRLHDIDIISPYPAKPKGSWKRN